MGRLPYVALFFAPVVGVFFAHRVRWVQSLLLGVLILLLLLDIHQFLQFEGGDQKGCEFCFLWLALHVAFGVAALVLGGAVARYARAWPRAR